MKLPQQYYNLYERALRRFLQDKLSPHEDWLVRLELTSMRHDALGGKSAHAGENNS